MTAKNEFWIPDNEVHGEESHPPGYGTRYEVTGEHPGRIVKSIERIKASLDPYITLNDCPNDVLMIVETRKHGDLYEPLKENGMDQQYRYSDTECLVSMSMDSFNNMAEKAKVYDSSFGGPKRKYVSKFNHVVDLHPNTDAERKMSRRLRETWNDQKASVLCYVTMLDDSSGYSLRPYLERMESTLERDGVRVTGRFPMEDGTVLLEVESDADSMTEICGNPAVLSATSACIVTADDGEQVEEEPLDLKLDPSMDPKDLGTVAILDTRVEFPDSFDALIDGRHVCDGADTVSHRHGAWVASKAVFGNMDSSGTLIPKNKVFDCTIYDTKCTTAQLAPRLEEAVLLLKDRIKVFNLSINSIEPLDRDDPLTKMADKLQYKYGIQIVISMGNNKTWMGADSLSYIFDDTDTDMTAPADSILGISVGAVSGETYDYALSKRDEPSPYTRRGMLVNGVQKPDMVARSGNVGRDRRIRKDMYSRLVTRKGFAYNAGTSFSAPYVAGLLESIRTRIGDDGILTSKAILYDSLGQIEWIPECEHVRSVDLFGYGLACERDIAEDGSRAVLMRLDSIKAGTEKTIKVAVPQIDMERLTKDRLMVMVTCVTMGRIDYRYGEDCVRTNVVPYCKNAESIGPANDKVWSPVHKRMFHMKKMKEKDWEIKLVCKSRDGTDEEVEYALIVSIQDPKGNDICAHIRSTNRYPEMVSVREMVRMNEKTEIKSKVRLDG